MQVVFNFKSFQWNAIKHVVCSQINSWLYISKYIHKLASSLHSLILLLQGLESSCLSCLTLKWSKNSSHSFLVWCGLWASRISLGRKGNWDENKQMKIYNLYKLMSAPISSSTPKRGISIKSRDSSDNLLTKVGVINK